VVPCKAMDTTPDRDGLAALAIAVILCFVAVLLWATPAESDPAPVTAETGE